MTADRPASQAKTRELIAFSIASQDFCMDIMLVREIRGWAGVTPLPHAPEDILGVMNLRGAVVPIIDLSLRLGLGPCEHGARNVIIISIIGSQTVGFLVTAVSDILGVAPGEIQAMPDIANVATGNFVEGIISSDSRTLRVLDISALGAGLSAGQSAA